MAMNNEIFYGDDQKLYLCLYFTITKGDSFPILLEYDNPQKTRSSRPPRSLRRGKLLNLPSFSLIHFLERKQKVNTHSHISVDDLPPNCWKL